MTFVVVQMSGEDATDRGKEAEVKEGRERGIKGGNDKNIRLFGLGQNKGRGVMTSFVHFSFREMEIEK